MSTQTKSGERRRLRGGPWGPVLVIGFVLIAAVLAAGRYVRPYWDRDYGHELRFDRAMFGPALAQPIAFSHRLHYTDKQIDCYYCHPNGERALSPGMPSVQLCLGCHNYIIPQHEQILKLKSYNDAGEEIPWVRVYYNPDHVWFPHYRHITSGVECRECHGEVERVDRLHKVTFYMGLCITCHREKEASMECTACHK
jgi:hypothetical protein